MNVEQASFDIDARSANERYADDYRASLASRAKVTGQARAIQTDPEGFRRAARAIAVLAEFGNQFDADDVRAWAGPFESPDVIGAAFSAAKKAGIIRVAGTTTSKSVTRHGGLIRLWEGVP